MIKALAQRTLLYQKNHWFKITFQEVGTAEKHDFLLNNYELDSVGWVLRFY
jgi:hypothetical protein